MTCLRFSVIHYTMEIYTYCIVKEHFLAFLPLICIL